MSIDIPWLWPLTIALALYLVSGAAVIAGRIGYERRRRIVERIEQAIRSESAPAGPGLKPAGPGLKREGPGLKPVGPGLEPGAYGTSDSLAAKYAPSKAGLFAGVKPEQARRLPFEYPVPSQVNQAIAQFLVATLGVESIMATARGRERKASRWKRVAALRVLALARPIDALPVLETATLDQDQEVVAAAVTALGRLARPEAAQCLVHVLEANRFPPSRVATFLQRFPLDVPELLKPLLCSDTQNGRYWGAVLARRYPGLPWLAQSLERLAHDSAPVVRRAAIQSLAVVRGENAVAVATAALADPAWFVRAHAARALGELRAADKSPQVALLLADKQWWVRQAAKEALVAMGADAEDAAMSCLSHPDRFARNGAAEVLQNLGVFERILARDLSHSSVTARQTMRLMRDAGGMELTRATIERLAPDLRPEAAAVLASLDAPEVAL